MIYRHKEKWWEVVRNTRSLDNKTRCLLNWHLKPRVLTQRLFSVHWDMWKHIALKITGNLDVIMRRKLCYNMMGKCTIRFKNLKSHINNAIIVKCKWSTPCQQGSKWGKITLKNGTFATQVPRVRVMTSILSVSNGLVGQGWWVGWFRPCPV